MGYGWSHFVSIVLVKWSVYKVITCRRVSSLHYEWVAPAVGSKWHDCDWTRHRESRSKQSLVFWPPAQCRAGPHTQNHKIQYTCKFVHSPAVTLKHMHTLYLFTLTHVYSHLVSHSCTLSHKICLSFLTHSHRYSKHTNALTDCRAGVSNSISMRATSTLRLMSKDHL